MVHPVTCQQPSTAPGTRCIVALETCPKTFHRHVRHMPSHGHIEKRRERGMFFFTPRPIPGPADNTACIFMWCQIEVFCKFSFQQLGVFQFARATWRIHLELLQCWVFTENPSVFPLYAFSRERSIEADAATRNLLHKNICELVMGRGTPSRQSLQPHVLLFGSSAIVESVRWQRVAHI